MNTDKNKSFDANFHEFQDIDTTVGRKRLHGFVSGISMATEKASGGGSRESETAYALYAGNRSQEKGKNE